MNFEIVDSVPNKSRTGEKNGSQYDIVVDLAMQGKVVMIKTTENKEAWKIQHALRTLIRYRALPLRVAVRKTNVYLERKDV